MSKISEIFEECESNNIHCSITWQRINDYSIEMYKGYKSNYQKVYYSDGHSSPKKAAKKGLKYLIKARNQ